MKPDIVRVEELVIRVKQGDIKLPKFQRPFIWKRQDCLNLWDSIYKGYPVGSVLLWLTEEILANENQIGGLAIAERPKAYPTNYLLDGQQRLSTLCGALYWDGADFNSIWNICFDLKTQRFLFPKDTYKVEYFPLNKLLETRTYIDQCKVFEAQPDKDLLIERADELLRSVKDYKIAAVVIPETVTIDQVAPIFERINSTGRKLTIYDLMRAATWKGDFDLNDTVQEIKGALEVKSFEKVVEVHILRNIAASLGLGINKADIESLRDKSSDELRGAANVSVNAYMLAVDFLTDELPISSYAYLPYALQLTYLVEFFRLCPNPNARQREALRTWFWKTSIGRYFASSNTVQISSDLSKIRDLANRVNDSFDVDRLINFKTFVKHPFSLNKAASKTFALMLAHNNPLRLLDGSPIDTFQALAATNRAEYHHIFPQAFLKTLEVPQTKIDAHANICLLSKGNNLTISNKAPSVYFPELARQLEGRLEEVLASNFITMDAYQAALADNYEQFLTIRSQTLIDYAQSRADAVDETTTTFEVEELEEAADNVPDGDNIQDA